MVEGRQAGQARHGNRLIFTEKKEKGLGREVVKNNKIGRNDPCNCGSKLKYKKCCEKRDRDMANMEAEAEMVPLETGMYRHVDKGRRDYVFTPLPKALKDPVQVCKRWVADELGSRRMFCEFSLWHTKTGELSPLFSCPIFEIGKDGFGDEIEEWGTVEFFERLKNSFSKAINDALEQSGLPRSYEVIDLYPETNPYTGRDPATGRVIYEERYSGGAPDPADGPTLIVRDGGTGKIIYEE